MGSLDNLWIEEGVMVKESNCTLFNFASPEDLEVTKAYYVELGRASAIFFSWVFVKDNILVQINGDLPEERAKQYEVALGAIGR